MNEISLFHKFEMIFPELAKSVIKMSSTKRKNTILLIIRGNYLWFTYNSDDDFTLTTNF